MNNYTSYLKNEALNLIPNELLQKEIAILQGVSNDIADELGKIQIRTVFDLATSRFFNNAKLIVEAGQNAESFISRMGKLPAGFVKSSIKENIENLSNQDINILSGIGDFGDILKDELNVVTIHDFANWAPFRAAEKIMKETLMPETIEVFDPERPLDLLPSNGNFPTEKRYYTNIVIDEIPKSDNAKPISGNPLDIDLLVNKTPSLFKEPVIGAILNIEQAWYQQGIALGNLVNSLGLAPGESTKIAIVDWERSTRASLAESGSESDSLSNTLTRNRALNEVTNAVAKEVQTGRSTVTSKSSGWSVGGAVSGMSSGVMGSVTGGYSSSNTESETVTSSRGRRDLFAEMSQNINDTTHQFATASRAKYASIVQEVVQKEDETLTTRTVTNYNHMHALTIQYYETVQIYRTVTKIKDVSPCVFIPVKFINDWTIHIIRQFKELLSKYALSEDVRLLLNTNELKRNAQYIIPAVPVTRGIFSENDERRMENWLKYARTGNSGAIISMDIFSPVELVDGDININGGHILYGDNFENGVFRPGTLKRVDVIFKNGTERQYSTDAHFRHPFPNWSEIRDIFLVYENLDPDVKYLIFSSPKEDAGSRGTFVASQITDLNKEDLGNDLTKVKLASVRTNINSTLSDHFKEHSSYYNQVIWRNLNPTSVSLLLSNYSINDSDGNEVSLLQRVDPNPVAMTGNYLGFRFSAEASKDDKTLDGKWQVWKQKHDGKDKRKEIIDIIPLPSDGLFAEAVLGRSNSAEKLDITRFWNWQDSPIPFAAPDIAALQAGGKSEDTNLSPSAMSSSLIQQQAPQSLPDPTGMSAIINALTAANMFRDMSGVQSNAQVAQNQANNTTQQHIETLKQAGENMKTVLDAQSASQATANGSKTAYGNISNAGATLNHGDKIDQKQKTSSTKNSNTQNPINNNPSNTSLPQSAEAETYKTLTGTRTPSTNANPSFAGISSENTISTIRLFSDTIPLSPETGGRSIPTEELIPGDIIVSTTNALVSLVIREFTSSPVSHAMIYIGDGQVVEAIGEGVVLRSIDEAINSDEEGHETITAVAFRHPELTDEKALELKNWLGNQLDKEYNYWGLTQPFISKAMTNYCDRNFFWSDTLKEKCKSWIGKVDFGINDKFFCSQLVTKGFQEIGTPLLDQEANWVEPGEIADLRVKVLEYVGHLKYKEWI